jgi:4-amino-4-deoxy-L-arabinose transferase-like glycosyltransferase
LVILLSVLLLLAIVLSVLLLVIMLSVLLLLVIMLSVLLLLVIVLSVLLLNNFHQIRSKSKDWKGKYFKSHWEQEGFEETKGQSEFVN